MTDRLHICRKTWSVPYYSIIHTSEENSSHSMAVVRQAARLYKRDLTAKLVLSNLYLRQYKNILAVKSILYNICLGQYK